MRLITDFVIGTIAGAAFWCFVATFVAWGISWATDPQWGWIVRSLIISTGLIYAIPKALADKMHQKAGGEG